MPDLRRTLAGAARRRGSAAGSPLLTSRAMQHAGRGAAARAAPAARAGLSGRWLARRVAIRPDRHRGGRSDPHVGQRAGRSVPRVPRSRRCGRARGALIFERSRVRRMRGDARRHRSRGSRAPCPCVVGRSSPPVMPRREFKPLAARFRMVDTYVIATPPLSSPERARLGPWRRDAVGHRAAVPLPALDAGPSAALRRRRSPAAGRAAPPGAGCVSGHSELRARSDQPLSRRWRTSSRTTPGRACSRQRRTGCPTSVRTAAIRATCSRSATAATA